MCSSIWQGDHASPLWRCIDTGDADGFTNMACDEAILRSYGDGLAPPTIRFYSWRPPALSLGYFQRIDEVDLESCRQMEVDVVRRTTGGRAILHDQELTYSLIDSEDDPLVSGNVVDSYRKISLALVAGLRLLDLQVELAPEVNPATVYRGAPAGSESADAPLGSTACFDAPCSYELTIAGKKLVGSAQTRSRGLILQHGSILLDFDAGRLVRTFRLPVEQRDDLRQKMESRATSIMQAGGKRPSRTELVSALAEGFRRQFGVQLQVGDLTPEERKRTDQLAQEKYRSPEWTNRR